MVKNHSKSSGVNDLYLYVGTIIPDLPNDTASVYNTEAIASGDTEEYNFYISNLYNLYNYNVLGLDISSLSVDSYNFLIQQVYNVNNYNGEPYENTNSLIANSGILYDSNNLTFGAGFFVVKAAEMINEGKTIEEVFKALDEIKEKYGELRYKKQ